MELKVFFEEVVRVLKKGKLRFAIAGGLAASVYRSEARLTQDLDFLLLAESDTEQRANEIIQTFKLESSVIRKADLEGGPMFAIKKKSSVPCIVAGRGKKGVPSIGLDFILPGMPWFEKALERAENNQIDFGFGPVPSLSVEDVILAKLYGVNKSSRRFKDLDDLQSIFEARHDLDHAYLYGQMQVLGYSIPDEIRDLAPEQLLLCKGRRS